MPVVAVKSNLLVLKQSSIFEKEIFKESISMLLLFALTAVIVYKMPQIIATFFIVIIVITFFRSKKDYFWLAYFFILICCPGNFFTEAQRESLYRLPVFSLGVGFTFTTHEVFMIAALVKALFSGRKYRYLLAKPLLLISFYTLFLFLVSLGIYGTSIGTLAYFLRNFLFYSCLISVPFLIKTDEDTAKFVRLPLPLIFFTFFTAVYFFITGSHFVLLFSPGSLREIYMFGHVARFGMFGGEHILVLYCFIFSLLLSLLNIRHNIYFNIVGALAYISILMTATRVWFVVFTLILMVFLVKSKRIGKVVGVLFALAVIGYGISIYSPGSSVKFQATAQRLTSIFSIREEGSQSYKMLEHKSENRLPVVLEGIKENPVLGWGFSDKAMAVMDPDVGNFSLIAQVGLVGFLCFIYFWSSYFAIIAATRRRLSRTDPFKNALSILPASFTGFLVAHFTTHQFFGLTLLAYNLFFLAIFIFLSDFFVREALKTR